MEAEPIANFNPERVEEYMNKAKRLVRDAENGENNKGSILDFRKKIWKFCEEKNDDPRNYAMYHIMFGTHQELIEWEKQHGISHEDLEGENSIAGFIDSLENKG